MQLLAEGWVGEDGACLEEAREGELVWSAGRGRELGEETESLGEVAMLCVGEDEGVVVLECWGGC